MNPADKLSTAQLAALFHVKPETVRRAYCVQGEYLTLRPQKLPNGRLLWPADAAERLLRDAA